MPETTLLFAFIWICGLKGQSWLEFSEAHLFSKSKNIDPAISSLQFSLCSAFTELKLLQNQKAVVVLR